MAPTPLQDRRPVVISGPSGVGKGTLCHKLEQQYPDTFARTVSHTTRKPRAGEAEGVAYFFVSSSTFQSLLSQNAFLEHAFFSGNHYGTSKQTVDDLAAKGLVSLLDIDIQGVKQTKADPSFDARYIFIKPPSFEVLESRLRGRASESEEEIQKELAQARIELEYADSLDGRDKIIVNDNLGNAFTELEDFIYEGS